MGGYKTRKKDTAAIDAAPIVELAAPNTTMQLISQTVTLRDLPHSLTVMVAQRLPVHPQQLFKAAKTSTGIRAAVDEVVLAIQQALCAEYGVDRIQDIPAGVLPKLSEDGETEQVLQFIVACGLLDGLDENGWTGLIQASDEGHTDIVNALILAGAALEIQDEGAWTGLLVASYAGHIDVVNALILAGAALDIQNKYGWTGLMRASYEGHVEIVNALILAGAALDIQNTSGCTGLIEASNQGHIDIVNALIQAGASSSSMHY